MTKEKLAQLGFISIEIDNIRRELSNLKNDIVSDTVKASSKEFPYTQHCVKISGIGNDISIKRLERKLNRRVNELMELRNDINDYIESIDDAEMRLIITLRHINRLSWFQIARRIGYQDESVPRKRYDRFVK